MKKRATPKLAYSPNFGSFIRPESFRFFYGYLILFWGTLGVWLSIPGQTMGISVFTDPVKGALNLSRDEFSNAYTLGTILSALFVARAGRWFDRMGARYLSMIASFSMAILLLIFSWSEQIITLISNYTSLTKWCITFLLVTSLFFGLRFFGQGVLTMSSRNMIMMWFERYRGRVNMITSIALSFGFSSAPLWMNSMIDNWGWSGAWQVMSLCLLVFTLLILLFYRVRPEDHGLLPDGISAPSSEKKHAFIKPVVELTLSEARSTRAFWVFSILLAFNSFFITGLTFHVISIFESFGLNKEQAVWVFLPGSVVAVTVSTIFNYFSDYAKLKGYAYMMIFGGLVACFGLAQLDRPYAIYFLIGGMGTLSGFFGVLNSVTWPRFYGRRHLGAITGKVMSFLVFSSAIAPTLFSYSYTHFGSYVYAAYFGILVLVILALAARGANNPQEFIESTTTP